MTKENKGGRPRTIDADFVHGVTRMYYVRALIRGGSTPERIAQIKASKIERDSLMSAAMIRDVLEVLIERGDLNRDSLTANATDKLRYNTIEDLTAASLPLDEEWFREQGELQRKRAKDAWEKRRARQDKERGEKSRAEQDELEYKERKERLDKTESNLPIDDNGKRVGEKPARERDRPAARVRERERKR